MDDLARFCCQNPDCTLYARRNAGNLSVCDRYGKNNHIRLLYCKACRYRFSERKGTPLFGARLPDAQVLDILAHLQERCGARQTSRLTGADKEAMGQAAAKIRGFRPPEPYGGKGVRFQGEKVREKAGKAAKGGK